MIPFFVVCIAAFVVGAAVGSFLNVCIYRIPAGLSIVHPGSRCPGCNRAIFWHDNIPLVSYLVLLGGKCRFCKIPIAIRYPFVELLTGFFAVACVYAFGPTLHSLVTFLFMATLIVVSFIDLDHLIIPDRISLPGIPVFFLAGFSASYPGWPDRAMGILAGAGSIWLISAGYRRLTGKDGMGGGDAKLLAMMGALIGWKGIIFTLFSASVIGTLVGLPSVIKSGKGITAKIPFGPFLSIGAVLYLFFGEPLVGWYLSLWHP